MLKVKYAPDAPAKAPPVATAASRILTTEWPAVSTVEADSPAPLRARPILVRVSKNEVRSPTRNAK